MPKKQGMTTTKALVNWEKELALEAQMATEILEGVGAGGQFISLRAGRMTIDGAPVPDNKLNGIVLDYILENDWYPGAYDADAPTAPDCYAMARKVGDLKPYLKVFNKQGGPDGMCAGCPQNDFGTANVGKGKACKNGVRMAVMPESGLENVEKSELRYLKVPVTSVRGWASYVRQMSATLKAPPWALVTEIKEVPDDKTQFKIVFQLIKKIDDPAQLMALKARNKVVMTEIEFPYPDKVAGSNGGAKTVKRRGQTVAVRRPAAAPAPRASGFIPAPAATKRKRAVR